MNWFGSAAARVRRAHARGVVVACWALPFAIACGREATVEDCDRIVQRITELELRGTVAPTDLGSEIAQTKRVLHDQALSRCVGKRITDDALECVARATSADEIVNRCFD